MRGQGDEAGWWGSHVGRRGGLGGIARCPPRRKTAGAGGDEGAGGILGGREGRLGGLCLVGAWGGGGWLCHA